MHYVGAFTSFGMGTLYFWFQSIISHRLEPFITLKKALYRMILSVFCSIFFVIVAVCGIISHILFDGNDPRHWYPSDGGWRYHVASSVSEWIVATIFSFYILTFADEFRYIQFEHPEVSSFPSLIGINSNFLSSQFQISFIIVHDEQERVVLVDAEAWGMGT